MFVYIQDHRCSLYQELGIQTGSTMGCGSYLNTIFSIVASKKNIARILKRCPENITLVVKCVKLPFYAEVAWFSKHRMLYTSRNVRLSVRLSVHFWGTVAPTSWNRMSNIFRDSESLGKSSGNKWSQIWTFLFENCLKSPRRADFALQKMLETTLPDGLQTSGRRAYR